MKERERKGDETKGQKRKKREEGIKCKDGKGGTAVKGNGGEQK